MGSPSAPRASASASFRVFGLLLAFLVTSASACVEWEADADLEGPRVIAASLAGPRTLEVGVAEVHEIAFSEPIDPASLAGALAIVEWEEVGRCDLAPLCAEGSCERGRCQVDPLGSGDLGRLDRGDFEGTIAVAWSIVDGPGGPGSVLRIGPAEPLVEFSRHSLVIGGALRDRSGAPLVDGRGERGRWRADFVTAGRGSSGPEAELLVPAAGEVVPRNLATVVTRFARPVALAGDDPRLELVGDDGAVIWLVEPMPCAGWVQGLCLEWRVSAGLEPGRGYRLGGGTIRDREGREAIPPPAALRFVAAADEDRSPPPLAAVTTVRRGRCVHAIYEGDEALRLELWIDGLAPARASGEGRVAVASFLEDWPGAPTIDASIVLVDRAGNHAAELRSIALGEGPEPPPLAIAEVLANPAGPEPAQEFVELVDPRRGGEAIAFAAEALWIADRSWEEIEAALAGGGAIGQALPPFETTPGARAVIVGGAYDPDDPSDPAPAAGATLLTLKGSIGSGGLSNGGEPLTLFQISPPTLVASMRTPVAVQTAADQGRSIVNVDAGGCDRDDGWRTHPLGSASPGWAP